ncbi:MAG: hypothetical protein V3V08_13195 [Nannocystaceae bacterium]
MTNKCHKSLAAPPAQWMAFRFSHSSRLCATAAAASLAFGLLWPASVDACRQTSTGAKADALPVPGERDTVEARRWFKRGVSKYASADYDGAINAFEKAIAALDSNESGWDPLTGMQTNLALAHVQAYGIDLEPTHLRVANDLYTKLLDQRKLRELDDEQCRGLERLRDEARALLDGSGPKAAATAALQPEVDPRRTAPAPEQGSRDVRADRSARARRLGIGGMVSLGLGVAGLSAMGAGLLMGQQSERALAGYQIPDQEQERWRELQRGARASQLAWVGGVAGGMLALVGTTLLLVRAKSNRPHSRISFKSGSVVITY